MHCPDELELQSLLDEELPQGRTRRIEKHVAGCNHCRMKIGQLNQVVSLLQEAIPPEYVPSVHHEYSHWRTSVAAAAIIIVILSISSYWMLTQKPSGAGSTESELMNQYFTIYQENCL